MRRVNDSTHEIIAGASEIHTHIGPGLLESVYEALLARTLEERGLTVGRQVPVAFDYKGIHIEEGFRVDLLVEEQVVVELKSVERFAPVHGKQLLTYLKLMDRRVGLLINFGAPTLKEGLRRVANAYVPPPPSL